MMEKTVKPFSAGYFILDAEVMTHSGDRLLTPRDYFAELSNYTKYPLLRVSSDHFWAHPEHGVPGRTIVLPERAAEDGGDEPILMAKDETAGRLVTSGEKERPQL